MDFINTENIFNVNQRIAGTWDGQTYWRVALTIDAPVASDYRMLIGLARQLGLIEADVAAVIGTGAFPAQLKPPGQPLRGLINAQWAYKPAVTALLNLSKTKLRGLAD